MIAAISLSLLFRAALVQEMNPIQRIECPGEVVIPMLPSARMAPIIELEIGGQKYKFALDTGAVGGRISPEIVKRLGLKPIDEILVGDPSGKNSRLAKEYRVPKIRAGNALLYGVRMFSDDGSGPQRGNASFEGVIGYAVFHDLLLTLDYPHSQVILKPGRMSADQETRSIPYALEHGLPLLKVQIGDLIVDGHVDSGSDGALSIPAKFKDKLHIDGEPRKVGHARTLFNEFDIFLAKVKDPISVGGIKMPIDSVALHDLFPFANIGSGLLRKFAVTIDQKKKRIVFDPAS